MFKIFTAPSYNYTMVQKKIKSPKLKKYFYVLQTVVFEKGSNQSSISIFFSKVKCGQNSSQSTFECLKVPLCVMLHENLGHSDSLRLLLILAHDVPSYILRCNVFKIITR